MDVTAVTGALCAQNGLLLKTVLTLLGAVGSASVVANFRRRIPPGWMRVIDAVALNWVKPAASEIAAQTMEGAKKAAPLIFAAVFGLGLAACVGAPSDMHVGPSNPSTGSSSSTNPLAGLLTMTVADLQAADQDALAHGDQIASSCWGALIPFVQQQLAAQNGQGNLAGAISAFQRARDLGIDLANGLPISVRLGCGPLVVDEQTLLARLAAIAAGSIALRSTALAP